MKTHIILGFIFAILLGCVLYGSTPIAASTTTTGGFTKSLRKMMAKAYFTKLLTSKDCSFNGIKLQGKVKFVTSFPDIKIQYVTSFPDIKVQYVTSFPDGCGKWQVVESFPDFKVQIVTSFPDLKVQIVNSFPGMN